METLVFLLKNQMKTAFIHGGSLTSKIKIFAKILIVREGKDEEGLHGSVVQHDRYGVYLIIFFSSLGSLDSPVTYYIPLLQNSTILNPHYRLFSKILAKNILSDIPFCALRCCFFFNEQYCFDRNNDIFRIMYH